MNDDNNKLAKLDHQTDLVTSQQNLLNLNLSQVQSLAKVFAASGMFTDIAKDSAKAFVKILAGQEMGIPPFQALSDIHIIQGKATAGGNIYAAKIKQSPKYDYRVKKWDERGCSIEFYQKQGGGLVLIGISEFTDNDARKAGLLSNPSWTKYPRNMYFNRAITNGVRTYCPDALGGMAAYTPDELMGGKDYIEVEETSMPVTKIDMTTGEVKEPQQEQEKRYYPKGGETKPVDKQLLDEDQDPDMPRDFLQYDREPETPDTVVEPTDEEMENISLPDMPEPKKKTR